MNYEGTDPLPEAGKEEQIGHKIETFESKQYITAVQ